MLQEKESTTSNSSCKIVLLWVFMVRKNRRERDRDSKIEAPEVSKFRKRKQARMEYMYKYCVMRASPSHFIRRLYFLFILFAQEISIMMRLQCDARKSEAKHYYFYFTIILFLLLLSLLLLLYWFFINYLLLLSLQIQCQVEALKWYRNTHKVELGSQSLEKIHHEEDK